MEQALILDPPSELHFKAPFTDITTSYINLTNPTDKEICFKVKTTAPKTYCVRPNGGVVQPKKTVSVAVMLQPLDLETQDKNRHKFMVQSIFAPEGEYSFDTLWRDTPPDNFMNSKLRCIFDIPSEPSQPSEEVELVKVEAKTAPQVQETPKAPEVDAEVTFQKLQNTHKRLQNELNELRQENSALKEEGLRSRVAYDTRSRGTSAKPVETELHQMPAKQQLAFSNVQFALAIVVFLCGLYIGKFFW